MAIEHWMDSLATDLRNEQIDLGEIISDAGHTTADEMINRLEHGAEEIQSLRARIAELEKDRERLDWLEEYAEMIDRDRHASGEAFGWTLEPTKGEARCRATLREAIDAAREGESD